MSASREAGRGRRYWAAALVFLAGVLVGVSLDLIHPAAHAQIPDAGMQRNQLQKEIEALNGRMGEVLSLLRTQTFKVRIVQDDESSGSRSTPKSSSRDGVRPGSK